VTVLLSSPGPRLNLYYGHAFGQGVGARHVSPGQTPTTDSASSPTGIDPPSRASHALQDVAGPVGCAVSSSGSSVTNTRSTEPLYARTGTTKLRARAARSGSALNCPQEHVVPGGHGPEPVDVSARRDRQAADCKRAFARVHIHQDAPVGRSRRARAREHETDDDVGLLEESCDLALGA